MNPSQDTHAMPVKERDEPLDLQPFLDEIQGDAVMHSRAWMPVRPRARCSARSPGGCRMART